MMQLPNGSGWQWKRARKEKQDGRNGNVASRQIRLILEREEERNASKHLSDNQYLRLSAETNDKRAAKLQSQQFIIYYIY